MTSEQIKERIMSKFENTNVSVIDITGIGSNFKVVFDDFNFSKSKLEAHRTIMKTFENEFNDGSIHALSISLKKN